MECNPEMHDIKGMPVTIMDAAFASHFHFFRKKVEQKTVAVKKMSCASIARELEKRNSAYGLKQALFLTLLSRRCATEFFQGDTVAFLE